MICKNIIWPHLGYKEDEPFDWCICDKCDSSELTDEQTILFESTINKYVYPMCGMLIKLSKTTKYIPKSDIEIFDERYAKVDI